MFYLCFRGKSLILVLEIMLLSLVTSQASSQTSASFVSTQFNISPVETLPRLRGEVQFKESLDGFLNPSGRRQTLRSLFPKVSELQDISPNQWVYEALRSLVERYDCLVGYHGHTFRGNRRLSRSEFAAGLNACIDTIERLLQENVTVLREDLQKLSYLSQEFAQELIALGARVNNLEERAAFLEDHQFSTTTILTGEFVVGLTGITNGKKEGGTRDISKVANLGFRGRLEFNTSFNGDDRLYTRLAKGTIPTYSDVTGTFEGELGFSQADNSDVSVELIIYEFSPADNVRMFVEPVGGALDDFAPTVNFLDGDGASGAISAFGTSNPIYSMDEGVGIGFQGTIFEVFEWSGGYLAPEGNEPSLGAGMFNGPYGLIGQFAYQPGDDFKIAFTYVHGYNNLDSETGTRRSNFQNFIKDEFDGSVNTINNSYGMEFTWRIVEQFVLGGWWGFTTTRTLGEINVGEDLDPIPGGNLDIWNWAVTLAFPDAFVEGDSGAVIVGMEPWVTHSNIELPNGLRNNDRDSSFHIETFYQYPLNDNIVITPGIIVITAPDFDNSNSPLIIGIIRTTLTF